MRNLELFDRQSWRIVKVKTSHLRASKARYVEDLLLIDRLSWLRPPLSLAILGRQLRARGAIALGVEDRASGRLRGFALAEGRPPLIGWPAVKVNIIEKQLREVITSRREWWRGPRR